MKYFRKGKASKPAINVVAQILIMYGYATAFAFDDKTKRYKFTWTKKGLLVHQAVKDIARDSFNMSNGVHAAGNEKGLERHRIDDAVIEILSQDYD